VTSRRSAIRAAYDAVAVPYAARFRDELEKKHFDRILLRWFASQIPEGETVLELGAGPGEISAYLAGLGSRCLATDGSRSMVEQGRRLFPAVTFQVEDFFSLSLVDASVHAVVAYYAFVNYPLAEVEPALREARRVLKPGGLFLFTFHALEAEEQVTLRTFLDTEVEELTFHFFDPGRMRTLVEGMGFRVLDVLVRHPYPDVEYASQRAYFVLRRP
jgi:ubiquinone/menaquinone biosynthesis C-methylase UbiE